MKIEEPLGNALPAEIKRVQAKHERWLGYAKDAGPQANFALPLAVMKAAINEGVDALASGDVARMAKAWTALKDYSDDD